MRRKGITPVIAVSLLLTITVMASGMLYTVVNNTQENAKPDGELGLNLNNLYVESCYQDGGTTKLAIRNSNSFAMNMSNVGVFLNTTEAAGYSYNPSIVNSQETTTLDTGTTVDSNTQIKLVGENTELVHYCR